MRVLVTGGTGFLGRHIVWRLHDLGHDVVLTGRSQRHASEVLEHAGAGTGSMRFVALRHGEAESARTLEVAADGAGAIVHCAALSSPWGRREDFERANVASTREVVGACAAHGIARLVQISTPSLYFDFRDRIGIREDEPLPPPVNDYARTKGIADHLVLGSPIPSVIALRPRAIFGAWDNTLLPRLLRVARRRALPLMRGGTSLVDLTYVDNVVDAVLLALSADFERATFNISNGEPMPVLALFEALAAAFGFEARYRRLPYPLVAAIAGGLERGGAVLAPSWEPPITRYSAGLLAFSQTLDLTRARTMLGYVPRIAFADGLQRTAAWFADHEQARP
jgi:nucleoside-diphosphate-sugar epimerase